MANTKFVRAVKKAKGLYKSGRYKTFADAVKAAYKKVGGSSVGATKKKRKPYQTGSSVKKNDPERKAKKPGVRKSATGRKYIERRKNRSDLPGSLTGVSAATLTGELKSRLKESLGKQLVRRELATTKRDKKKVQKEVLATKLKLRRLQ